MTLQPTEPISEQVDLLATFDPAQITAILDAIQVQVGDLASAEQVAALSQQVVGLMEQMDKVAKQADAAGRTAQAEEARKLSGITRGLLFVISGITAEALWRAFIQDPVYEPLAKTVGDLLRRAEEIEIGPPPPSATVTPQKVPAPAVRRAVIEFDWVTVPAGEFLMGSDPRVDRRAKKDEQPQRRVYVASFKVARSPVTNRQFSQFVLATGYTTQAETQGSAWNWYQPRGPGGALTGAKADHPVVWVSWKDAIAFCRWANVRLPTEAEWEKAARGTDGRLFPWGNTAPTDRLCNLSAQDTTPVGYHSPAGDSPYGCCDMAGNVLEWTASLYRDYPYHDDDGRNDPKAEGLRVLRGGSWIDIQGNARCPARDRYSPDGMNYSIGLRVAMSLSTSGVPEQGAR